MKLTKKIVRDVASLTLVAILLLCAFISFADGSSATLEEIRSGLNIHISNNFIGAIYLVAAAWAATTFDTNLSLKTRGDRYVTAAMPLIFYVAMIAYYLARTGNGTITIAIYGFVFALIWIIGQTAFNELPDE